MRVRVPLAYPDGPMLVNAKGSGVSRENGGRNGKENAFALYDSRERPATGKDSQ